MTAHELLESQRRFNQIAVVLSMYADEGYVREAAAGRRYLSAPLTERAIQSYVQQIGGPTRDSYHPLLPACCH